MTRFRFLPDIATADIAFEAFGKDYSELFSAAGLALEETMISLDTVQPKISQVIQKEEVNPETLLHSFLEELVFIKDTEGFVANKIECDVSKVKGKWRLKTGLLGEKIDIEKHKLGDDVKAVTKHLFSLEQLPDKTYKCTVVLDV